LQFITLLLGVAVARVIAFLTAFVALNTGLVFSPFVRLRSWWSFLGTLMVRTWLALRSVELHLLQSVVVVVPVGNVPFGFPVSPFLGITAFLLQL
jgi:hypothetical protein